MCCCALILIFWIFALMGSIFYGAYSVKIFTVKKWPDLALCEKIHYFWQNFICSFSGWVAAYYLIFIRTSFFSYNYDFVLGDTPIVILALTGITGTLPWLLTKITSLGKS